MKNVETALTALVASTPMSDLPRIFTPAWITAMNEAADLVAASKMPSNRYNKAMLVEMAAFTLEGARDQLFGAATGGDAEAVRIREILQFSIDELYPVDRLYQGLPKWFTRNEVGELEYGNLDALEELGAMSSDDDEDSAPVFGAEMDGQWWTDQESVPAGTSITVAATEEEELAGQVGRVVYLPNREHFNAVSKQREENFVVMMERVQKAQSIEDVVRLTSQAKLLQAVAIAGEKGQTRKGSTLDGSSVGTRIRDGRTVKAVGRDIARSLNQVEGAPARVSSFQWGLNYSRAAEIINACAGMAYEMSRKDGWPTWDSLVSGYTWVKPSEDADADEIASCKEAEKLARAKAAKMTAWLTKINAKLSVSAIATWPEEKAEAGEDVFEHMARQGNYLAEEAATVVTCQHCEGSGWYGDVQCPMCEGYGEGDPALIHERYMSLRIFQVVEHEKALRGLDGAWVPSVEAFRMETKAVVAWQTGLVDPMDALPMVELNVPGDPDDFEVVFPKRVVVALTSGVVKTTARLPLAPAPRIIGFDSPSQFLAPFIRASMAL